MVVGDKSGPEFCDFIIMKSDVVHCDGPPGKTTEDHLVWVDAILCNDFRDDFFGVSNGGFFVAPPSKLILFSVRADEGKVKPGSPSAGEAEAKGRVFDPSC